MYSKVIAAFVIVGLVFTFDACRCSTHIYGPSFYGHEVLKEEAIWNGTSHINHTFTYIYEDVGQHMATQLKLDIPGFTSTVDSGPIYRNRTIEIQFTVYDSTNFTATALIYGFQPENIKSDFQQKLYATSRTKDQPLEYILGSLYTKEED